MRKVRKSTKVAHSKHSLYVAKQIHVQAEVMKEDKWQQSSGNARDSSMQVLSFTNSAGLACREK